ncbi:MAG: CDP-alcohol phosphatidyltransferase family protein [Aristaeellaceae bacterium]
MANAVTLLRMVCSLLLLCFPVFSAPFFLLYALAGLTDMADGLIARRTHTVSDLGARLDTAADFVFVAACFIKLLPVMELPVPLLIWTGGIAVIKMVNAVYGLAVRKQFAAVHSTLNRLTGLLLFALPLTMPWTDLWYSGSVVCLVATLAAIQEGLLIRSGNWP